MDTHSVGTSGQYTNGIFQITAGSIGTNITGITFHNTRINISSTQNIHVDNITVLCESNTGFGVGSFTVRDHSSNITVTNSYFKTLHNGGHSNVVIAGASYCLFENNTVIADCRQGGVGNTFYLTTYNTIDDATNIGTIIRNNNN